MMENVGQSCAIFVNLNEFVPNKYQSALMGDTCLVLFSFSLYLRLHKQTISEIVEPLSYFK